ncbi:LysR family transcriptional regulator [Neptuniibacter sp. 2_MG-2023]|jgi:DNA-binding transcriptional LysR family regulator|uniref:LysR family transcriptional regulator n=1 Tax=Neptuniibacter sp. 2_MG-2023 TaxID=3062671 RepID=UPI0026E2AFCC|nr:LysR family transcriptional regulator [Neptuniibacter sp. 2_MG-2023]MDO6514948.1 LysR family transcriptional regulator [Neptuniibacter sp. 2_MG-2023]
MNKIYWNGIRSFLAVAKHGSFSVAAEATGLSKASLSQQVSHLEQLLNVQLLYRTTRSLRLSEVGVQYYEMCKQGFDQLDAAQEWAQHTNQELQGAIKVNSVGGIIGEDVIAPLLIGFQREYPQINVELDFSSRRVDLINDKYDLVIRMGDLPDSSLIARKLHTLTTHYVASPSLMHKYPPILHPQELNQLPMICGSVTEWEFSTQNEQYKINFKQGFKIPNGRVMLQAAQAGLGVARLPDIYVQTAMNNGDLIEILPDWAQSTTLSLICPPSRYQLQRIKTLMDWLATHFQEQYDQVLLDKR